MESDENTAIVKSLENVMRVLQEVAGSTADNTSRVLAEISYLQKIVTQCLDSQNRLSERIAEVEKTVKQQQQGMNTLFTFEAEQSDINAELRS